jgi:glycosyltransferase involved in cell wall biosynthesis
MGMRIAYPYPVYWPYVRRGVERCIHNMSTYLAGRGHQVDIITSKPGPSRVAHDGPVRVIYLGQWSHPLTSWYLPHMRLYSFAIPATYQLMQGKYDVAHLWSYSFIITAPLLRRWKNMPYLFQLVLRKHRWPGRADWLIFQWLMRQADRVAALTPNGAEEVKDTFGINAITLPPPVDMETFRPCAPKDLSRPRILFPSDLGDARKGGLLLLSAWDEIHHRCPEAVLVLAGPAGLLGPDGWDKVYTVERLRVIRSPAARAAVEIAGPGAVEELPAQYSRAAVTVLPSVEEAFGIVITESLASGTPVVCSAYDGPGEIVTNPEVGVTVPIKTYPDLVSLSAAKQLAEAVLQAIELARKSETSKRCRDWAETWSLDKIGALTESRLMEIASSRNSLAT